MARRITPAPPGPGDTVLLTGASTGLGLALARRFVASEFRIVLTARAASLARFGAAGIRESDRVRIRPLDVTDASERRAVVAEMDADWGGVDVLINNAGISYRSVVEHVNEGERLAQMQINFLGPMHLMRLVLPGMRAKRRGRILNVSSVGGMMAMPTMAIYSASKFALEGATEALSYDGPWGIHVSLVEPGFIRSDSFRSTRYTVDSRRSSVDDLDPYHAHYENMGPFIARLMSRSASTPDTVAETILRTIHRRRPPLRVQATCDARLFAVLRRMLPQRLYHWGLFRCLPSVGTWGPTGKPLSGVVSPGGAAAGPTAGRRSAPRS